MLSIVSEEGKQSIIEDCKEKFEKKVKRVKSLEDIEKLRVKYLGRKGEIRGLFGRIKEIPATERGNFGSSINQFKEFVEAQIKALQATIQSSPSSASPENQCDLTLPGIPFVLGHQHPITQVIDDLLDIFRSLNFDVVSGFEIEDTFHNFDALNIHKWHPSRNKQDTFYLDPEHILRTQTSAVQIRAMEKGQLPIRIVSMGRCYRRDASDATHYPVFQQIEGLVVDENVSFCDLSGILTEMMTGVFGKRVEVRFLPSYFPFFCLI